MKPNVFFFQRRMINAMGELKIKLNNNQPLIDILLKKRQPEKVKPKELQFYNKDLNKYQKMAVEFTVSSKTISLIHGPPGNRCCANVFCIQYESNLILSLLLSYLIRSFTFVGVSAIYHIDITDILHLIFNKYEMMHVI